MNYNTMPLDELTRILIGVISAMTVLLGVIAYAYRSASKSNKDTIDSLLQSRVEDRKRIEVLELTQQEEYANLRQENEEFKKEVRLLRDEVAVMRGRLEERENQRTLLLSENSKKDNELGAVRQKWSDTLDENTKLSEQLSAARKVIEIKETELAEALESKEALLKASEAKHQEAQQEIAGLKATNAMLKDQVEARSVVKELIAEIDKQPTQGAIDPEAQKTEQTTASEGIADLSADKIEQFDPKAKG